jgi:hypothetical protein
MPLPDPKPGLVIHYSYLWAHEHARGHEEGVKDRPAVIVGRRRPSRRMLRDRSADYAHGAEVAV